MIDLCLPSFQPSSNGPCLSVHPIKRKAKRAQRRSVALGQNTIQPRRKPKKRGIKRRVALALALAGRFNHPCKSRCTMMLCAWDCTRPTTERTKYLSPPGPTGAHSEQIINPCPYLFLLVQSSEERNPWYQTRLPHKHIDHSLRIISRAVGEGGQRRERDRGLQHGRE